MEKAHKLFINIHAVINMYIYIIQVNTLKNCRYIC